MPAIKKFNSQVIAPCTDEAKMCIHAMSLGLGLYRSDVLRMAMDFYIKEHRDEIIQSVIQHKENLKSYFDEDTISTFLIENGVR